MEEADQLDMLQLVDLKGAYDYQYNVPTIAMLNKSDIQQQRGVARAMISGRSGKLTEAIHAMTKAMQGVGQVQEKLHKQNMFKLSGMMDMHKTRVTQIDKALEQEEVKEGAADLTPADVMARNQGLNLADDIVNRTGNMMNMTYALGQLGGVGDDLEMQKDDDVLSVVSAQTTQAMNTIERKLGGKIGEGDTNNLVIDMLATTFNVVDTVKRMTSLTDEARMHAMQKGQVYDDRVMNRAKRDISADNAD